MEEDDRNKGELVNSFHERHKKLLTAEIVKRTTRLQRTGATITKMSLVCEHHSEIEGSLWRICVDLQRLEASSGGEF